MEEHLHQLLHHQLIHRFKIKLVLLFAFTFAPLFLKVDIYIRCQHLVQDLQMGNFGMEVLLISLDFYIRKTLV
jgi:hypothetical protein